MEKLGLTKQLVPNLRIFKDRAKDQWDKIKRMLAVTILGLITIGSFHFLLGTPLNAKIVISWIFYFNFLSGFFIFSNYRIVFFVLLLLAVPSVADDIFPGGYIGFLDERNATKIPIITNIDLTLVTIFFWYKLKNVNLNNEIYSIKAIKTVSLLGVILALIAGISGLNALMKIPNDQYGVVIKGVVTILRLVLVQQVVFLLVKKIKDLKQIITGIMISFGIISLNAVYLTLSKGASRLQAGGFGMNTFGNFLVLITIVFLATALSKRTKVLTIVASSLTIVSFLEIILTGTRMALIALIVSVFTFLLLSNISFRTKLKMLGGSIGVLSFVTILGSIFFKDSIGRIKEIVNIGEYLQRVELSTSTTLGTRLIFWSKTKLMVMDNLLLGVGPSMWNFTRYKYGLDFKILLDTHNGYLQILSEYGLLFFLVYLVFIAYAMFTTIRFLLSGNLTDKSYYNLTLGFLMGTFGWLLTELTNSGFQKPIIFSFVGMVLAVLIKIVSLENSRKLEGDLN